MRIFSRPLHLIIPPLFYSSYFSFTVVTAKSFSSQHKQYPLSKMSSDSNNVEVSYSCTTCTCSDMNTSNVDAPSFQKDGSDVMVRRDRDIMNISQNNKNSQNYHHVDRINEIKALLLKEANYNPTPPSLSEVNVTEAASVNSNNALTPKRSSYVAWKPFFLAIAKLTSQRSKDPQKQVGACIVDAENRILGIGYNGFPRGCSDDLLPWSSRPSSPVGAATEESDENDNLDTTSDNILHNKDWFMVHAEVNAILNKIGSVSDATMYVYGSFPCHECAKVIIQAGIKEVVYVDNAEKETKVKTKHQNSIKASRILFGMSGVKVTDYSQMKEDINKIPDLEFGASVKGNAAEDMKNKSITSPTVPETVRELLAREAQYDPSNKKPSEVKRTNYLSWDDYFTSVASLSAYRSKDPNTQVGACIVDKDKCIIGIGYNGFPRGCSDDYLPWSRNASNPLHTKYLYVVHAEVNAILNRGIKDCAGATLYVRLFPCNDCAKVIIQSGIKEVVYLEDIYHDSDSCRASRIMLEMAGVRTRQYCPSTQSINVDIFDR